MRWIVIDGVHVGTAYRQNGYWHIGYNVDFKNRRFRYVGDLLSSSW